MKSKFIYETEVHIQHCCKYMHECKYGHDDCPVVSGSVEGLYECDHCEYDGLDDAKIAYYTKRCINTLSTKLQIEIGYIEIHVCKSMSLDYGSYYVPYPMSTLQGTYRERFGSDECKTEVGALKNLLENLEK